ncbi:MAG TPA: DNA repair protein RecO [Acidimicrobiia bacterium]|nr:DNA repair protein RecO [Acidimicrobiia bacterium]
MGLYRDQGVVVRTIKLGEADRIVTILTRGQGKVRAVAKGVRKPGSRFGARLEPTSHVALQCYRGRELDIVTQVETIDAHRALREHYGCLTHAVSMLEAVDQVAQEREPNLARYRMLVGALRTLAEQPSPIVSTAFFWKLLSLEGFHPLLDVCVRCGDGATSFAGFDLDDGGVLCEPCARTTGRRVDPAALAVIGDMVGGRVARVLADPPPPDVLTEVERLGIRALEYHSERRLRSAALL